MKRKLILFLLTIILCFAPLESRVRIKHIGPVKERTEEESKRDTENGLLFAACFIGLIIFLKWNKKRRDS